MPENYLLSLQLKIFQIEIFVCPYWKIPITRLELFVRCLLQITAAIDLLSNRLCRQCLVLAVSPKDKASSYLLSLPLLQTEEQIFRNFPVKENLFQLKCKKMNTFAVKY